MSKLQAKKVSARPAAKPRTSKQWKPKFPGRADIELEYQRAIKAGYSELAAIEKAFTEVKNGCSVAFCTQALSIIIGSGLPASEAVRALSHVVGAVHYSE